MSELLAPIGAKPEVKDEQVEQSIDSTLREPVFISEQEVLFATAAAVHPVRRRWTDGVVAVVRAMLTWSPDAPRERRQYAARNDFLENSRMAREMDRL